MLKLTIVIQAGGTSQRMGYEKGLASFLGAPLITRVVQRVQPIADELLITTNRPNHYGFLDLPLIPDLIPGKGALGGLYTALSAAAHPLVAIVACDMPFISAALISAERAWLEQAPFDVAIPRTPAGNEPFHAVYRRETCLPLIRAALEQEAQRVDAWFRQARLRFIEPSETRRFDPKGLAFTNINTPEELSQVEALAKALETLPHTAGK